MYWDLLEPRGQGAESTSLRRTSLCLIVDFTWDSDEHLRPKVTLEPTKAQTLALALHELATKTRSNTARFRLLRGVLSFGWDVKADAMTIHWHETAVWETQKPSVTGFGTQIITGSISGSGGKTELRVAAFGLRCTLATTAWRAPA